MFALFKKEIRQHGMLVVWMIGICFLYQLLCVALNEMSRADRYYSNPISEGFLFGIAFFVTVLYAGSAAGLTYSTEHAHKTFAFLRGLPISPTMLAVGKIGWALCGTAVVLLATFLITAGFITYQGQDQFWHDTIWEILTLSSANNSEPLVMTGFILIEVFVWGLFWSTICRSQSAAVLGSFACPIFAIYLFMGVRFLWFDNRTEPTFYEIMLYRLVIMNIMAPLAIWKAFRWFTQEKKGSIFAKIEIRNALFFRYPKNVQPQMLALMHHHVRHASLLYSFGILCFIVFGIGCLFLCSLPDNFARMQYTETWWWTLGMLACMVTPFVFWGMIFGHDQRNDSYLYLSRIGVYEGKVWWSRILPPLPFYLFGGLCFVYYFFHVEMNWDWNSDRSWNTLMEAAPYGLLAWLAPVAMGAFCSISFKGQMRAIVLTCIGMMPLFWWAGLGTLLFGCNSLWTTLPICIALLVSSRLRAYYWLREKLTWRTRLLTLTPVLGTMLAVVLAVPAVRVYSIPYISWTQMDAYFAQTDLQQMPRMSPENRRELIRYIEANNAVPPEYDALYAKIKNYRYGIWGDGYNPEDGTYEEHLLVYFFHCRNVSADPYALTRPEELDSSDSFYVRLLRSPWETARRDRIYRAQLVALLVDTGGLHDEQASAIRVFCWKLERNYAVFDSFRMSMLMPGSFSVKGMCDQRLRSVAAVIRDWYHENDETFPVSLDDLHLAGTPVQHPFSGEPMEYHVNAPPSNAVNRYDGSGNVYFLEKGKSDSWSNIDSAMRAFSQKGGTYLQLGEWTLLLVEPDREVKE